eukprot:228971-Hanusia_phi.AAC.1
MFYLTSTRKEEANKNIRVVITSQNKLTKESCSAFRRRSAVRYDIIFDFNRHPSPIVWSPLHAGAQITGRVRLPTSAGVGFIVLTMPYRSKPVLYEACAL